MNILLTLHSFSFSFFHRRMKMTAIVCDLVVFVIHHRHAIIVWMECGAAFNFKYFCLQISDQISLDNIDNSLDSESIYTACTASLRSHLREINDAACSVSRGRCYFSLLLPPAIGLRIKKYSPLAIIPIIV